MKNKRPDSKKLYEIASLQSGYFTSKQAKSAGFFPNLFNYHVKAGNWERSYRGIYRLVQFPIQENEQYVLWALWSRDRNEKIQGVYSHETALNIYELSDVSPSKLHMTVPLNFRRNSKIPGILRLHRAKVSPDDVDFMQGFAVTKPMRTIIDMTTDKTTSQEILIQAIIEGCQRGFLTRFEIVNCPELKDIIPSLEKYF